MEHRIRRVVTGHDVAGEAIVVSDQHLDMQRIARHEMKDDAAEDKAFFGKLWTTDRFPADNNDDGDGALRATGLTSAGGTVLRIVDIPPGQRSPMHRTCSLDYGIVLIGEIELELDGGRTVRLSAGDVVIQRGTIHAWTNVGEAFARMAFVLIEAKPVVVRDQVLDATH